MIEDETVRWHHQLNESEQTPGDGERQGSLASTRLQGRVALGSKSFPGSEVGEFFDLCFFP